jgi:hypothetical protein
MWVITASSTGEEIDRVETVKERDELIQSLSDNEYGELFAYRWED